MAPVSGPLRFARFAFPPNQLGYCGPGDADGLTAFAGGDGSEGVDGVRHLARGFEGAYPYLQLLAGANRRDDPLDADVVEAYWIGNELLDRVSLHDFGTSIDERFRKRAGGNWGWLEDRIPLGVANHSFHVLHAMPWAGLMRDGVVDEPLGIVDRCRISWATVLDRQSPGRAVVARQPLVWSGSTLVYGEPSIESVSTTFDVAPGDTVAVHWDWICERLSERQLGWLRSLTDRQLAGLHAG